MATLYLSIASLMLTLKVSVAPSLALTYTHVAINALGPAADVAMNTARWLIGAVERSVIGLTALVIIDVLASATMGSHVVHVRRLVRYVYCTFAGVGLEN